MGIVNVTDNSFFSSSRTLGMDRESFSRHIAQMIADGADILDFGACSTAPGVPAVTAEEEWARLAPALEIVRSDFPDIAISIDTFRSVTVRKALECLGREFIINDVYCGARDREILKLAGSLKFTYVATHSVGETASRVDYGGDVVGAVKAFFERFANVAADCGIEDWLLDPGFGFSKTLDENWELLKGMGVLLSLGRPILAGVSRKSMIYKLLSSTPEDVACATQTTNLIALLSGATVLRVHDVRETSQTIKIFEKALC